MAGAPAGLPACLPNLLPLVPYPPFEREGGYSLAIFYRYSKVNRYSIPISEYSRGYGEISVVTGVVTGGTGVTSLVAVSSDTHVHETVAYALQEGRDAATTDPVTLSVLLPVGESPDGIERAAVEAVRTEIETVADETQLDGLPVEIDSLDLPAASATARVEALLARLPSDTSRLVLAPGFQELTPSQLSTALATTDRLSRMTVERGPVGRTVRQPPLALPGSPRRTGVTFLVAFGFYLLLGDPTKPFDIVTGLLSAGIVTLVLSRVVFESDPSIASLGRVARAAVYLPYLLVEVVRANLAVAWVVLHPDLPIEPQLVRVPAPEGRIAQALLANSITLTPGTLTVDIVDDELVVHTLTAGTRTGLQEGSLARAVAFVMHGRRSVAGDEGGD